MKRLLLLIMAVMAFAGMSFAQDVYSIGNFTSGKQGVKIYKNGELLQTVNPTTANLSACDIHRFNDKIVFAHENTDNTIGVVGTYDPVTHTQDFASLGSDSYVYEIMSSNAIWAVGSKKNGSIYNATAWTVDGTTVTVQHTYTNGSYNTYAYCGVFGSDGLLYVGGYQHTGNGSWEGVIWRSGAVLYTIPEAKSFVTNIAVYDGNVYSLVKNNNTYDVWIYKNDTRLYTITDINSNIQDMYIDGGDIYVCGWEGTELKVWKNGEVLYSHSGLNICGVRANSAGVYYCGYTSSSTKIWKDGQVLYEPSGCESLVKLYVEDPECADANIRTLPYSEGFDTGETDWECWTKIDEDNSNGAVASYWHRADEATSVSSINGNFARHNRASVSGSHQTGWLITPRLFLQPGREGTALWFDGKKGYGGFTDGYASVWVSTDSDPTDLSAYDEVWSMPSTDVIEWQNYEVDLTDYQGEAVYVAFKYDADAGTSSQSWCIDNVVVDQWWSPYPVEFLPFYEGFESEIPHSWYIIDYDHTGDMRCWMFNEDYNCAYHHWGQNNGIQQEGALFTPRIDLTSGSNFKLSFKHSNYESGSGMYNGVWYALDETGVPDPSQYNLLWHDTEFPTDWTEVEIDLSAFAGHVITLGFSYEGTYAHNWYIDDVSVTEVTAPEIYTITTEVDPVGAGTVTGADTYPAGEHVFLTATPNPGWRFSHWNDGVVTNPREIVVDGDAHYIATFLQENYTLTVEANPSDGGVVTGAGTNYHYGDMVTLTAMPNTGYNFVNWNDGSTDALRTVEVTGNAAYVANFSQAGATMYTVTVSTNDASLGSVIGGGTYPEGTNIQIQAIPVSNARFVKWDDGNTDNPRNITVTQNMSFLAEFEAIQSYTITVQSSNLTMGSVVGGGTFPEGTVIQISAIANPGYYFTSWNDNNAENPRTITVKENATYIAQFSENQIATYTVTTICNPEEGMVVGSGEYTLGATVTLVAIPNSGFEFDKWNDGNTDNPRTITVTGNITYVAFFKNTGIDEGSETRFALYPNPANDCIYLEGIEANSEVRIYNTMGALVKVVNANANEEIGIGDLSNGLYVVRCGNSMMRFVKK